MRAASDVYEIVVHQTGSPNSRLRNGLQFVARLFGTGAADPHSVILSIVHQETGHELFRHIEDLGDDDGHMLADIERDLASMTVEEFELAWAG